MKKSRWFRQAVKQIWAKKPGLRLFLVGVELTEENSARLFEILYSVNEPSFDSRQLLEMQIENYQHLSASLEDHLGNDLLQPTGSL